jgi:2,5-diamino-6-(ribosylamino)-4(3H)-pyrimidinone 5'-phosphate reductase
MKPKTILHNSMSLDGEYRDITVDMAVHYAVAGSYAADVHLVGSNTVKMGIEKYGNGVPPEEKTDFEKPSREGVPLWAVVDSRGTLRGMLHTMRRFEFCRDVVVLISEKTPADYVQHLEERNYDYIVAGSDHVDYKAALEELNSRYGAQTVLTDSGSTLDCILLDEGLVDELSLLVVPELAGKTCENIFCRMKNPLKLELICAEEKENGSVLLRYNILAK